MTGEEILSIRRKAGLTQTQLGDLVGGIHKSHISMMEHNKQKPTGLHVKLFELVRDGKLVFEGVPGKRKPGPKKKDKAEE